MYEYQNGDLGDRTLLQHGLGDRYNQIQALELILGDSGRHFLPGWKAVESRNVSERLSTFRA